MKNGRLQAKDIADDEVFIVLGALQAGDVENLSAWPVGHTLSEKYPWKVVARKLDSMERRGLIERFGWGPLYGLIKEKGPVARCVPALD